MTAPPARPRPLDADAGPRAVALAAGALDELCDLARAIDVSATQQAIGEIVGAQRVYFTGTGRSGLVARALAMRLMHTGLAAYAVGEIATPAIGPGDLLVALSAKGSGAVAAQADKAARTGARVLALTAAASSPLALAADAVLLLPARTVVATTQHAGTLFEQGCLIVGDAACAVVRQVLNVPETELDRRHANLP